MAALPTTQDRYEVYLTRAEYQQLQGVAFADSGLQFAVEMCHAGAEPVCQIWPDAAGVVALANALGHIPLHYHLVVAQLLRDAGWNAAGPPIRRAESTAEARRAV